MKRQIFKYFAIAAIAVMSLTSCEVINMLIAPRVIPPCKLEGTGILKVINKNPYRLTVKIDGINHGQVEARGVNQFILPRGEYWICLELSNAICMKEYNAIIIPCETLTLE
jgi:hypothetical protein